VIDAAPHVATLADSLLEPLPEPNAKTNSCTGTCNYNDVEHEENLNMTFKTMQKENGYGSRSDPRSFFF
jgi:hypothetical protein